MSNINVINSIMVPRKITATEDAIRFCLRYTEKAPGVIESLLARLHQDGSHAEVLQISGVARPIWRIPLPDDCIICFTIGVGAGTCEEIRIVYAGQQAECPDHLELSATAAELHSAADDSVGKVVDQRFVSKFPPTPSARIGDYTKSLEAYLTQDLTEKIPLQMESLRGRRFRILPSPDPLLRIVNLRLPEDLPLRLGPKQQAVLNAPRPLLLQGVAGSGKTTVVVHAAVRQSAEDGPASRVLVVVYHDALKRYVASLLDSLGGGNEQTSNIQVLTYRELCDSLAKSVDLSPFRWVEFNDVFASLRLQRKEVGLSNKVNIQELLEEIRVCIKGCSLCSKSPLVSHLDYVTQGDRNLHVSETIKSMVYTVAEKHQIYLGMKGLVDEMDAAQILLTLHDRLPRWEHVFVDEVQDYTLVQLVLLANLSKNPGGLLFAGDEHQVVYASQFSWERVVKAIEITWHKSELPVTSIDTNYRNTLPIMEFSKALLEHRNERLKLSCSPSILTNQPATPIPLRAIIPRGTLKHVVNQLATQISSLGVIYPTQSQVDQNHWKLHGIAFRRGFCPQSVKGLEFDVVCLVGFGEAFADIATKKPTQSAATDMLRFNQLYVSLTRPRRLLLLVDQHSKQSLLWDNQRYVAHYELIEDADLLIAKAIAESTTSDEMSWRLAAMDFERQEAYGPAAECWERASHWERAGRCLKTIGDFRDAIRCYTKIEAYNEIAMVYEHLDNYDQAAPYWEMDGEWSKAARCWERIERYDRAVDAWQHTDDVENTLTAKALFAEQQKQYKDASIYWEQAGNFERAAESSENALDYERALRFWDQIGSVDRSKRARAYCFERSGQFELAAKLWQELSNTPHAAINFERAHKFKEASTLWIKVDDFISASLAESLYFEFNGDNSKANALRDLSESRALELFRMQSREARQFEREAQTQLRKSIYKPLRMKRRGRRGKRGRLRKHAQQSEQQTPYHIYASDAWKNAAAILEENLEKFNLRKINAKNRHRWNLKIEFARKRSQLCMASIALHEDQ
jgi:tetratricopeptide (TPR) repeat protein